MSNWASSFDDNASSNGNGSVDWAAAPRSAELDLAKLASEIHKQLLKELDVTAVSKLEVARAREAVDGAARNILSTMMPGLVGEAREDVIRRVVDDAVDLGPLEPLLRDNTISEVMVNSPNEVFFERDGMMYESDIHFQNDDHILRIIERILAPLGRRVDESAPFVDARLPDGSRVNVIIPPLIPRSPTVTIRKFRPDKYTIHDLISNNTVTADLAEFIKSCVRLRFNMLIAGGSGTGKTTLLNAFSAFIPETERIVTIEDPIELKLQQKHVIAAEARPSNIEGRNEVTQRDLFRNTLRMRPDRIIVGEVRGPEAFDMLQAMNTGHEGSMTTVHANSPRDALWRIENMVLMSGLDLPVRAIREQMASALRLVIQVTRFADGRRRITRVTEIAGMEGDTVTMQDLFKFEQTSIDEEGRVEGDLLPTGITPTFIDLFEQAGITLTNGYVTGGKWA